MSDTVENGLPGTCPKCGSQTPIGHRCIVDDLAAIRDADLSDHPLMQAIKDAAPAESDAPPLCPVCGGNMRFCECMDDPFAPVPDSPIPPGTTERGGQA